MHADLTVVVFQSPKAQECPRLGRRRLKLAPARWTAFLALMLLCASHAGAQVAASLSGQVTDPSGAAVQAATVTARNVETGVVRTTASGDQGYYQLFALPLGEYEVRANKSGFAESVRKGVHLVVGEDATVDFALKLGQVSQQIEVTEDAPLVSTTTTDISGVVGEQQVKDLPLNGRSFDLLMPLNPGNRELYLGEDRRHRRFEFDERQQLRRFRQSAAAKPVPAEWRRVYRRRREQHAARRDQRPTARR